MRKYSKYLKTCRREKENRKQVEKSAEGELEKGLKEKGRGGEFKGNLKKM